MHSYKETRATTSRNAKNDDDYLIDEYGMAPDQEYLSLSDRKKNVVNQMIFQMISGKKPYYDRRENKYSNYCIDARNYISDVNMGSVKNYRYDELCRVAISEAGKLVKNDKFQAIAAQKRQEKLELEKRQQQIQQEKIALEREAKNKRDEEKEWLGLSTIWAMNSGFRKIQDRLSEKVDVARLKKELTSLNSGDRHWEKGPYGSETIRALYDFYDNGYDEVGSKLEDHLAKESQYSHGLLYRGTTVNEFSQWMNGMHMTTRFVPTSHAELTAKKFGQYIIEIENGYGKNVRDIYQNGDEAEFIINRGSRFKFISNQGNKRIRVRQIVGNASN
ncbi:hypothetical protein BSQ98_25570 [Serratia liquefaciens]|uniref:hypothetical protein n=1 Tax=Serratia liquefaciens TaxID=614 RepID=UPI001020F399|nr:hypothetical protein [Serratia liquefaciens]RYM57787.1 hypothetical protein BSQ98_25570 [Serratia liquefaciens]